MRKGKLRMFLIIIILFFIASFLSVYSYGHFAKRVKGEESYTLPVDDSSTHLDQIIAPQLKEHPNQSSLMLLTNNLDAFAMRAMTAREAGRSIDLQYYIWHQDLTGSLLIGELIAAADRGVRVRLLLDDMNAHGSDSLFSALNMHPNISIRLFNPTRVRENRLMRGVEMLLRLFSVNRRMHNKAWIVDGRVAIVGGRNIGDEYFDASQSRNFFDIDLLVAGPAVTETSDIFDSFWNSEAVIPLEALSNSKPQAFEQLNKKYQQAQTNIRALPYIQTLHSTPSVKSMFNGELNIHWSENIHVYSDPVEKAYSQAESDWLMQIISSVIMDSKRQLRIISPYFVPGKFGVEKLTQLREQQVEVDILTNSLAATDVLLVHSGYAPYRKSLLTVGVNLYELKPFGKTEHHLLGSRGASLHTKAFWIDENIGFVGSFNFDPRSVMLNTEMGVLFEEPKIVAALQQEFKKHQSYAYSYQLILDDNEIRWQDVDDKNNPFIWEHDPQSKWWQRLITKVMSYLPIESQL